MARWGIYGSKGASNVQGVVYLNAAASSMRRAKIVDWSIGSNATPADAAFSHIAQRCTALPAAGTTLTPNALDPADTLASTVVANNAITSDSAGLTASAFLFNVSLNQRAALRWVAVPYFELVIPATANYGYMLGLSAVSTTTFVYGILFDEQ